MKKVFREAIKTVDVLEIRHIRKGKVIGVRNVKINPEQMKDLVTNVGKAQVAGLINGEVTSPFKWIAIGTDDDPAPAAGDTALNAEITTGGGARKVATCSQVTTTVTNDTAQLIATFDFTASFTIVESGVFDQLAIGGNMICRQIFTGIGVESGDSLQMTWKLQAQ